MPHRSIELVPLLGAECWKDNCEPLHHEGLLGDGRLSGRGGRSHLLRRAERSQGQALDPGGCRIDVPQYQDQLTSAAGAAVSDNALL
jgi:hypothetical protein